MVPAGHDPIGRLRRRTTNYTVPHMFARDQAQQDPDVASAFRERIGRLERERPGRRRADAALTRICLARAHSTGLRERLGPSLARA
jgi:hypothetical protein